MLGMRSQIIKKRSRGVLFWRKRKVWCAKLLLLCAQMCCVKRRKHCRVLSMAQQGSKGIAWFKEEYCVSTHLVWGVVKSEALQFLLWKPWICKDLLSLCSDAQVLQATCNARDTSERESTKFVSPGWIHPNPGAQSLLQVRVNFIIREKQKETLRSFTSNFLFAETIILLKPSAFCNPLRSPMRSQILHLWLHFNTQSTLASKHVPGVMVKHQSLKWNFYSVTCNWMCPLLSTFKIKPQEQHK